MKGLIEALEIFLKYGDPPFPTHCEHDVLGVVGIDPDAVSDEDKARLEELGFIVGDAFDSGDEYFYSYRYGSA